MERIGPPIVATPLILYSRKAAVMFAELPLAALFGTFFMITLALAVPGDVFILPALPVAGGRSFIRLEA